MAVGTTAFPTSLDTVVELVEIKNNASSTLSGNVLIGDVTIGVTDISEFPTTGYGTLTDDLTTPTKTEIISWTGISGSNLTGCTRGTQGTSAAAFSSGNYIEVRPTAGHHEALRGAVIAIETKLGTGSTIAVNKLEALTASRLMVTDASGFASAASVTATEAGYLSGVTSAIQTQLGTKAGSGAVTGSGLTMATARLLGRTTASSGAIEEISIGSGLSMSAGTLTATGGGGSGDVVGPGSATDNAVSRFDGTTGKLVKNSVVTIADTTGNMAGVGTLNTHTIPVGTDTFVLLTANQTLTTKTLTSPDINGGTADSLTSLSVRSTGAAFDLLFANTEVLTGNKTLTLKVNDTSRTVDLGGNLTLAAAFSTSGANALTLTTTGATNVTLPTTGTLVNSAVSSLSSLTTIGTITSGGLGTGAVIGGVTMTLGSDADGDIYYRSSNVLTRLAKGTALQRLRMNAGATAPEWFTDSGGGLTIGTTAITSGTVGRMLYEASGNVVGEAAGITYQTGASPTVTITAQAASYVGLKINSASTPSTDVFQVSSDNGTTTHFKVTSTGAPSAPIPGHAGSERYGAVTAYATTSTAAGAVLMGVAHNINVTGTLLNSVVMGRAVTMSGSSTANASVIIGSGTGITLTANRLLNDAVVIGQWVLQSQNYHGGSVYIGSGITGGGTDSQSSVAIGTAMNYPQGAYGISIGAAAQGGIGDNTGYYVALGGFANANYGKSVAIGAYATTTAAAQFVSGSSSYPMTDVFFGKGVTNAAPTAYAINGTGGSGTDIAGANINIASGKGTGTGIPGTIGMQFARAAASTASTLNALSDEWRASYSTTDTVTLGANIKTSTTTLTSAAAINALWTTATHASRTSAITLSTVDNAASLGERWRLSTNGAGTGVSTTTTGFFGGTNVTGMLSESITLSTSGTTTDSTIDLPANSIILSVTGRITTTITTATDWKLGDATIADRFSDANATLTSGTTTVGINQWKADRTTAGQGPYQASTAKVRITTTGTPGAGVIRITIHYITLSAPTS